MRTPKQNTFKNMKDENGIVVTEDGKIMELWKRYYQTLLEGKETEEKEIIPVEKVLIQERNPREEPVQNDMTMEELAQTTQKMKNGKTLGHDEITIEMIKALNESGLKELLKLLNDVQSREKDP